MRRLCLALAALGLAATAAAAQNRPIGPTPDDILKASPKADWAPLDPAHTLYMDLQQGQVVIALNPAMAPLHVANIETLVRQHFFDGLAIDRLQAGFVAQWGDPEADEDDARSYGTAKQKVTPEFSQPNFKGGFTPWPDRDTYAVQTGFIGGMPAARDPKTGETWLAFCPAAVGVARDTDPDSGSGGELFAVIGPPARKMDRNLTVVGRVVDGLPLLARLKPGSEPQGFYRPDERTPIIRVRLGSDIPAGERKAYETLKTDSKTFRDVAEALRQAHSDFYRVPLGAVELCDAPLAVRPIKP